ncbi:MAG TPA: response regulator [Kofleriaceae bacterium]|nr:response regulator [Kofleriaceae bacterium]
MGRAVRGRRLLLIDGDSISRTVLRHAFSTRGHTVSVAATAAEAIAIAASNPPEVVVYDWSFRDESGVGLAKQLRAAVPHPIVIVSLSVLDEPDGFREREDVDDYVVKPALAESVELAFEHALAGVTPRRL